MAAERGETVRLRCLAVGAPIVKFLWSNEEGDNISGVPPGIKHSTRTSQIDTVTWESVLFINNVDEEDFGRYACTGTNEMGNDTLHVVLKRRGEWLGYNKNSAKAHQGSLGASSMFLDIVTWWNFGFAEECNGIS